MVDTKSSYDSDFKIEVYFPGIFKSKPPFCFSGSSSGKSNLYLVKVD